LEKLEELDDRNQESPNSGLTLNLIKQQIISLRTETETSLAAIEVRNNPSFLFEMIKETF
jgi:hypothetical protein